MQVELLVTLKAGKTTWKKGLVLDDEEVPFPDGILAEMKAETGSVRIIKADVPDSLIDNKTEQENGIVESTDEAEVKLSFEEINQKNIAKAFGTDTSLDKLTKTDISKMNKAALATLLGNKSLEEEKTRNELIDMVVEKLDDKE